jgi:hypothetical protein
MEQTPEPLSPPQISPPPALISPPGPTENSKQPDFEPLTPKSIQRPVVHLSPFEQHMQKKKRMEAMQAANPASAGTDAARVDLQHQTPGKSSGAGSPGTQIEGYKEEKLPSLLSQLQPGPSAGASSARSVAGGAYEGDSIDLGSDDVRGLAQDASTSLLPTQTESEDELWGEAPPSPSPSPVKPSQRHEFRPAPILRNSPRRKSESASHASQKRRRCDDDLSISMSMDKSKGRDMGNRDASSSDGDASPETPTKRHRPALRTLPTSPTSSPGPEPEPDHPTMHDSDLEEPLSQEDALVDNSIYVPVPAPVHDRKGKGRALAEDFDEDRETSPSPPERTNITPPSRSGSVRFALVSHLHTFKCRCVF